MEKPYSILAEMSHLVKVFRILYQRWFVQCDFSVTHCLCCPLQGHRACSLPQHALGGGQDNTQDMLIKVFALASR